MTILILPDELYDYIDTFFSPPGISDEEIVGSILLDLIDPHRYTLRRIDIKPLLHLLRRAENLIVSTHDIIDTSTFFHVHGRNPTIQDILADLYDIHDMDMFLDYVDQAMTALELRGSEETGIEIVFELGERYWEEWMAEWSKESDGSGVGIPVELQADVVRWGRGCGMELDTQMGSHLTVNFRRGG
jgi:hypothetical protein